MAFVSESDTGLSATTPKSVAVAVQAGDVIVVQAATQDAASKLGTPTSDGAALTWTPHQVSEVASNAAVYLWTAVADSARSVTVTVARTVGTYSWAASVEVWRGVTVGSSAKGSGTGAPSLALTTTSDGSSVSMFIADWNAASGTSRTWRTVNVAATETYYGYSSGAVTLYGGHHTDAGAAGTKAVGLSAPTGQKWTAVGVELTNYAHTDTVDLGVTDVRTLAATSSRTDTVALGLSDSATLSISNAVAVTDTVALGVTDKASIKRAASRADLVNPWDLAGQWPTIIRSEAWERAVSARVRTLAGWVELVDPAGNPVQVQTDEGPRWRLPASGASVTWRDQMGGYSGQLTFADPWMIPTASRHPLWGASGLRARVWWAVWSSEMAAWLCKPVATLAIGDTDADDTGTISGRVSGRDVLATMQGYGGSGAPDVVGMTVSAALGHIFARSAPTLAVTIAPSSVIIPEGTVLRDPMTDAVELAEIGYTLGVVRSDCLGAVYVGPRLAPADEPLDWQEGPGCPVSRIKWKHGVEAMGNHVRAVSTHPDAVGLYVVREDDDPTSPTWVGGPWGVHPLPQVESSIAVTIEALSAAADAALDRGLHPTEDVEVEVPQRPDMDRRTTRLTRDQLGVAAIYTPASWSIRLPVAGEAPASMPVGMMQRTV